MCLVLFGCCVWGFVVTVCLVIYLLLCLMLFGCLLGIILL